MSPAHKSFASFILFKEMLADELGHLYRAAEFTKDGITRTVFLRVFDGPRVPKQDLIGGFDTARRIGDILQAANVVSKPALFEKNGIPALAFDYLPAQPLSRLFDQVHEEGFPVPVDNALLIMEKLALALAAGLAVEVGGRALVHGFLHPANILISNDGEGLVAGFGLGNALLGLLDHPQAADELHPYLAPEVLLTRTPGKRSDVYSLGAILFQLLTGTPVPTRPEDRDGILDSADLAYDERPIPDDIRGLLTRALASRPEDRYSSAADFKKELDKLLYGGNYSPTTFNLALFMDRLFRADIEAEEKDRVVEEKVDHREYLQPEQPPAPEPLELAEPARRAAGGGKGMLFGIAASAVVVIAVVAYLLLGRAPAAPPPTPTPSPEEVAAERAAQEERLKELASQMFEERMKQREEELRTEMLDRQQKIEDLQKRLRESEQKASLSADEKQRQQELQQQIASEKEEARKKEAEAERERQRILDEARKQAGVRQTATAVAEKTLAAAEEKPTPPAPTRVAAATDTKAQPSPAAGTVKPPAEDLVVTENMFLEPSQVDTLPVVLKDQPVTWPRSAMNSRRKGMVIVQATVDAQGAVEDIKILRTDDDGFGIPQAVIEAVRNYTFKPATKNGVKVKSYATVTKRFNFRGR